MDKNKTKGQNNQITKKKRTQKSINSKLRICGMFAGWAGDMGEFELVMFQLSTGTYMFSFFFTKSIGRFRMKIQKDPYRFQ